MAPPRKPFVCECGRNAIKYDSCHAPVCARCNRIELQKSMRDGYSKQEINENAYVHTGHKDWKKQWCDEDPILLPDALARVEAKLKSVDNVPA